MSATSGRPPEIYFASERSRTAKVEHWDRDCPGLSQASNTTAKPASAIPEGHYPVCRRCGTAEQNNAQGQAGADTGRSTVSEVLAGAGVRPDTCPNGDRYCNGEADLREGRLPCSECMHDASDDLWETMLSQRQ